MSKMTYVSPSGKVIDLVAPGDWVRALAYGGVSGLVGTKTASTAQAVSVPGQVALSHQTNPMKGELTLLVVDSPAAEIDWLVAELNREFSPDAYGTLVLDRPQSVGRLSARVRLDGPIAFPKSFLGAGDADDEVRIPLVSDEGLWSLDPVSATGVVTVTNVGDDFVWPVVTWSAESEIVIPSGTTVGLPAAGDGGPRRVSLNPFTSHEVTVVSTGEVDEALTEHLSLEPLGEGVPRGKTRTYHLEGDAALSYSLQFLNPWR